MAVDSAEASIYNPVCNYTYKEGRMMVKARHNMTMSKEVWNVLNELKKTLDKSISEILEEAVLEYFENHKYNLLYFKLMANTEPCDDEENEELTKILDSLTKEDIEVVRVEEM